MAQRSPEKGLKAALEIEGEQQQNLINEILQGWGQRNPQQLADWALKEKDPTGLRIALDKNIPSVDAEQLRRDFASLGPDSMAKEMTKAGGIGLADTVQREILKLQGLT